jgi:hypothetical protein
LPDKLTLYVCHIDEGGPRPELKAMSGQEKLPVMKLPDGTFVNGSSNIIAWAKANSPVATGVGS